MNLRLPNYLFFILKFLYLTRNWVKNIVLTMLRKIVFQFSINKLSDKLVNIFFRIILLGFISMINCIKTNLISCLKIFMSYFSLVKIKRQLVDLDRGWFYFELTRGYPKIKLSGMYGIEARLFNCPTFVNLK